MSFAEQFCKLREEKRTLLVLGVDPDFAQIGEDFGTQGIPLPEEFVSFADAQPLGSTFAEESIASLFQALEPFAQFTPGFQSRFLDFLRFSALSIFAVRDEVVGVKFQAACFEILGTLGFFALSLLLKLARSLGLLTIVDAKRGDIGVSLARYAESYLGSEEKPLSVAGDAMTVNPLVGVDTWEAFVPYLRDGRQVFMLTYPSSPGGKEIAEARVGEEPIYRFLARRAHELMAKERLTASPAPIGFVVGAKSPDIATEIRKEVRDALFLVPGVGAQGGKMSEAAACAGPERLALFPVSRSLLLAYRNSGFSMRELPHRFFHATVAKAASFNAELRTALRWD